MFGNILRLCVFALALLFPASNVLQAADATSFDPRGIYLAADGSGGVPVGTVVAWPSWGWPSDGNKWLECNGQWVNPAAYPELASLVGANVPNYQGMFLRGYGTQYHAQWNGGNVGTTWTEHSSWGLGQIQGDSIRNINGEAYFARGFQNIGASASGAFQIENVASPANCIYFNPPTGGSFLRFNASGVVPISHENRPANMAVRYLIRAAR